MPVVCVCLHGRKLGSIPIQLVFELFAADVHVCDSFVHRNKLFDERFPAPINYYCNAPRVRAVAGGREDVPLLDDPQLLADIPHCFVCIDDVPMLVLKLSEKLLFSLVAG